MQTPTLGVSGGGETPAPIGIGTGGGITVTHTSRQLKAYNFTESDLDTISVTNTVTAVSFAVASAVLSFCIDLNKDVMFAGATNNSVQALQWTVNWLGIPVAIVCAAIGLAAWAKRGSVIKRVKDESQNPGIEP